MLKIKRLLPRRKSDSNKGDYGKLLVVAGSEGMLGAAVLASRGALRVGTGLVYLNLPPKMKELSNLATPEVIISNDTAGRYDAVAIGPGLGDRRRIVPGLLARFSRQKYAGTIVIDADGLNALAGRTGSLENYGLNLILTPHPGEMARLLNKSVKDIQKIRDKIALHAARSFNCVIVLKGHRTVVASPEGKIYANRTGNPGMATAGVGDVLTGVIAGLAAQGLSAWDAATAGVFLHGLAGDLAARDKGQYGMIASDLIEQIPYAIQKNS